MGGCLDGWLAGWLAGGMVGTYARLRTRVPATTVVI